MSSTREYLDFVMEQLSELDDVSYRAMMGEYVIYYHGKVVAGIYDDRFLVKPTKTVTALLPNAIVLTPVFELFFDIFSPFPVRNQLILIKFHVFH